MRAPFLPCASVVFLLLGPAGAGAFQLIDDFLGGVIAGSPSSGVSFTSTTAVLPSNHDGIDYGASLFPSSGTFEVRLRIDVIGTSNPAAPGGTSPNSVILDSRGAGGRAPGDLFVFVEPDGRVRFTLNEGIENPRQDPVHQVVSTTSILDGAFHSVAVSYGIGGLSIAIDGTVEDTHPFALEPSPRRFSLADYSEAGIGQPDGAFGFGFEGEVDFLRITALPEPGVASLVWATLAAISAARIRSRASRR